MSKGNFHSTHMNDCFVELESSKKSFENKRVQVYVSIVHNILLLLRVFFVFCKIKKKQTFIVTHYGIEFGHRESLDIDSFTVKL